MAVAGSIGVWILFSDAKPAEHVIQQVVGGDGSEDCAELADGAAQVLGDEVGGSFAVEAQRDLAKVVQGSFKRLVMAKVRHHCGIAPGSSIHRAGTHKPPPQFVHPFAGAR